MFYVWKEGETTGASYNHKKHIDVHGKEAPIKAALKAVLLDS